MESVTTKAFEKPSTQINLDDYSKKARKYLKRSIKQEKEFNQVISEYGTSSQKAIDELRSFTDQLLKFTQKAMEAQEYEAAQEILNKCNAAMITKFDGDDYCQLHYEVNSAYAQLYNEQGQVEESLRYLNKAIKFAQINERLNSDPLALLPAETYLNAANALSYFDRLDEALDNADRANHTSEATIQALSALENKISRGVKSLYTQAEVQDQIMAQLDIRVLSLLVKGQLLAKQNILEESLEELTAGRVLLEENFGSAHPLMQDFNQLQNEVQNRIEELEALYDSEDPQASPGVGNKRTKVEKRSELMKKGRVVRIYMQETEEIQQVDQREDLPEVKHSYDICSDFQDRAQSEQLNQSVKMSQRSSQFQVNTNNTSAGKSHRLNAYSVLGMTKSKLSNSKRNPFKLVCKNGTGCKNHDWSNSVIGGESNRKHAPRGSNKNLSKMFVNDQGAESKNEKFFSKRNSRLSKNFDSQSQTTIGEGLFNVNGNINRHQSVQEHNMVHQNESQYAQQLMAIRQMQDEQFRMQELMIASQPAVLPPPSQMCPLPQQHNMQSAGSVMPQFYWQQQCETPFSARNGSFADVEVQEGSKARDNESSSEDDTSSDESVGGKSEIIKSESEKVLKTESEKASKSSRASKKGSDLEKAASGAEDDHGLSKASSRLSNVFLEESDAESDEGVHDLDEPIMDQLYEVESTSSSQVLDLNDRNVHETEEVRVDALQKAIRSAGGIFTFSEMNFEDNRHEQYQQKQESAWDIDVIKKIQLVIKMRQIRKRAQQALHGYFCVFYTSIVSTEGKRYCAKVTVKKVLCKKTKRKHRRTIRRTVEKKNAASAIGEEGEQSMDDAQSQRSDTVVKDSTEVTDVQMMEMFVITVENYDDHDNQQKVIIADLPARSIMIEYIRKALTITWENDKIEKVEFKALSKEEEDELWRLFKIYVVTMKMALLELERKDEPMGHSDSESAAQDGGEDQKIILEADPLIQERIRRNAAFVASENLTKEQLKKKIEWQARQILTKGNLKYKKIKKLVVGQSETHDGGDEEQEAKVIIINKLYDPADYTEAQEVKEGASYMNMLSLVKLQSLVRGFLIRMALKNMWDVLCKFFVRQHERYFSVKVMKAIIAGKKCYRITVTDPGYQKKTVTQTLTKLPFHELHAKRYMKAAIQIKVNRSGAIDSFVINQNSKVIDTNYNVFRQDTVEEKGVDDEGRAAREWDGRDEFIYNYVEPNKPGRHLICKFCIPQNAWEVSLFFQITEIDNYNNRRESQWEKLYLISVKHLNAEPGHDIDYIKLRTPPVAIKYMVYYIKLTLKVYTTVKKSDVEYESGIWVDYACLQNLTSMAWFNYFMKYIESNIKNDRKQHEMRQLLEKKLMKIIKTQTLLFEMVIQRPSGNYRVRIFEKPEDFIPYTISVNSIDDVTDVDEVKIHQNPVVVLGDQLKSYLNKHIKIYLEVNNRIRYVALTDREMLFVLPSSEEEKEESAVIEEAEVREGLTEEQKLKLLRVVLWWRYWRENRHLLNWRKSYVAVFYKQFENGNVAQIIVSGCKAKKYTEVTRNKKTHTYENQASFKGQGTNQSLEAMVADGSRRETELSGNGDGSHHVKNEKTTEIQNEELIDAYQIKAINMNDESDVKVKVIRELPSRKWLIDVFSQAINVTWNGDRIHRLIYNKPNRYDVFDVENYYKTQILSLNKQIRMALSVKADKVWREVKSHKDEEGHKFTKTIYESDVLEIDEPYLKIEISFRNEDHEKQVVALQQFSLVDCYAILYPSKKADAQFLPVEQLLEECSYGSYMDTWDKFLVCIDSGENGKLVIYESKFRELRYSVKLSDYTGQVRAINAAKMLQRAIKRYLTRKRSREARKISGYMNITGVVRMNQLYFVYIMVANKEQTKFNLTLKERNGNIVILKKYEIREKTVQEGAEKGFKYKLQGLQAILSNLFKTRVSQVAFGSDGKPNEQWQFMVEKLITENF